MDEGTILVYCCPSTFSLTSPPPPSQSMQYTDSVLLWGVGGVELCWRPYSAGLLHSVSDQIQNPQNCFTTPNIKITTKDDIKGFVSLKFLRPGWSTNTEHRRINCLLQSTIAQFLISFSSYSKNHASKSGPSQYSVILYCSLVLPYKKSLPNYIYAYFYLCSFGISTVMCIFFIMLRCVGKEGVWKCRFKLDFF